MLLTSGMEISLTIAALGSCFSVEFDEFYYDPNKDLICLKRPSSKLAGTTIRNSAALGVLILMYPVMC